MISNIQKRTAGGASLNKVTLAVTRAVTAGQDLYVNEAGDIAPSGWFTGVPIFLDNTSNPSALVANTATRAGDVSSFDADTTYVAYLVQNSVSPGQAWLHVRKVNPNTGELLASVNIAVSPTLTGFDESNAVSQWFVQVIPVSATVVSVVLNLYRSNNISQNVIGIKFTQSGETFTNGGWSSVSTTTGNDIHPTVVAFAGVSPANRWGVIIRTITNTTAVAYVYKHATNTFTLVSLSFSDSTQHNQIRWVFKEGTDNLIGLVGNVVATTFVKWIDTTAGSTGNSNTLNLSGFASINALLSTGALQLMVGGYGTSVNGKNPHRVQAVTISADMTTITAGAIANVHISKIGFGINWTLVGYCNGVYVFGRRSTRRAYVQPNSGGFSDSNYANVPPELMFVKGSLTALNTTAADVSFATLPYAGNIEECLWQPIATRRWRVIYCAYYASYGSSSGFGRDIDRASLTADCPWLFMPEFFYATGKNGLAYVGSANANIAAGASGLVTLGLGAVKLNGNITPVKANKAGVVAVSTAWGIKIPQGQRNDGSMSLSLVSVSSPNNNSITTTGNVMHEQANVGIALYLENVKGSIATFSQGVVESNPGAGASTCSVVAYIDGKLLTASIDRTTINNNSSSLRADFAVQDSAFVTQLHGSDWSGVDTAVRKTILRYTANSLEAKYHE